MLQRAARTGEPVPDFAGRLVRADGSTVEVMISATPLHDERGEPRDAIASVLDIVAEPPTRFLGAVRIGEHPVQRIR